MRYLLLIALMCLTPIIQADTPPASQPQSNQKASSAAIPNKTMFSAIFLYGRASYFHDIMQYRNCAQINADLVNSTDQRLDNARLKMIALYGEQVFAGHPPKLPVRDGACDEFTIDSYSNHVAELEQLLNSAI